MLTNWYFAKDKEKIGPFTFDQLKQLVASGVVRTNEMVWNEGASIWVSAESVPGLVAGQETPTEDPRLDEEPVENALTPADKRKRVERIDRIKAQQNEHSENRQGVVRSPPSSSPPDFVKEGFVGTFLVVFPSGFCLFFSVILLFEKSGWGIVLLAVNAICLALCVWWYKNRARNRADVTQRLTGWCIGFFLALLLAIFGGYLKSGPPLVEGLTVGLAKGDLTHDFLLKNGSSGTLRNVKLEITLVQEDGQWITTNHSWPQWEKGEEKKINVRANRYGKLELHGTADQDGKKRRIYASWMWEWK